jgi:NADPH-dependent glutamate synthase beta subunit-like oxidoreductase
MTADSPIWTSGTSEVYHTGTWRSAIPKYINPPSPCHSACPVDGNIALWIHQIKEKEYHKAFDTLAINNPFPCIAGRICHHPCEPACNRGAYDEPISI